MINFLFPLNAFSHGPIPWWWRLSMALFDRWIHNGSGTAAEHLALQMYHKDEVKITSLFPTHNEFK